MLDMLLKEIYSLLEITPTEEQNTAVKQKLAAFNTLCIEKAFEAGKDYFIYLCYSPSL